MTKKTDAGQVTNYIYNTEDRLKSVEDGSGSLIAQYYYDPFGRRLCKEVGGVRTYFVYADEGLVAEVDAAGNVVKSYGYKPGSTWSTDPLFMKVSGQYYFYQNDHLGTPQKLTAVNGAVVWSAKYSSFGEAGVDPTSTIVNNLRFPGQYYDQETGLNYNWHRYYYPVSGRYTKKDPINFSGGDLVLYNYGHNNPQKYWDNRGLSSFAPGVPGYDVGRELDKFFRDLWNLFVEEDVKPVKKAACKYGFAAIGVVADTVSILAYSSVVGAEVGVAATGVSACNTLVKVAVCGSVTVSDGASLVNTAFTQAKNINVKVKIGTTVVDIAVTLGELIFTE
jgi:RHS repeat-associated protein